MVMHYWKRIEDLPDNWQEFVSKELEALAGVWKEQRSRLEELDAVRQFNERFRREWAIETGIIENLYSIDRGTTRLLKEQGLEASLIPHNATDKPAELVIDIIKDQEDVLEGLLDYIGRSRELSTSYVKELHASLTRHQPTVKAVDPFGHFTEIDHLRGDWKRLPNNPTRHNGSIHQHAPPEHVASEMDRLIALHQQHIQIGVAPEVEVVWFHHRFTQIHPFQDGNGRIARALASLILLRAGYFPLLITRDQRNDYITACEEADLGDLKPLIQLFVRVLKASFLRVFSISQDIMHDIEPMKQMISAVKDRFNKRQLDSIQEKSNVFEIAQRLKQLAQEQLSKLAYELQEDLFETDHSFKAIVNSSDNETTHFYKSQIVMIARDLGYYADMRSYHSWVRMRIRELRQVDLIISFHSLGFDFVGILAVSAFVEYRDRDETGTAIIDNPHRICQEVFQFSYQEQPDDVEARFIPWLDDVILAGLDEWRRQL